MDWNDLKFFLAVARAKSLSSASRQLGVSVSTVSRRIAALEQALGLKLFRPHRDGYDLTEAGADLMPAAENAAAQMTGLERGALEKRGEYSGEVRMDAPELLGQHILLPNLAPLAQAYPEIRLDIRSSVRPVRLTAQESDIVLRLVRPDRGSYSMRTVGRVAFGLYCSSGFADRYGTPGGAADLQRFRVIGWNDELRFLAMALWLEELCPDVRPSLKLSSFTSQLEAARCGLGIAVLPCFAAEQTNLLRVLKEGPTLSLDLWLLVREQSAKRPGVRIVSEFLRKVLAANEQVLKAETI